MSDGTSDVAIELEIDESTGREAIEERLDDDPAFPLTLTIQYSTDEPLARLPSEVSLALESKYGNFKGKAFEVSDYTETIRLTIDRTDD